MTTPSLKRRRRRLLQFSLRTLLVFVLLVSIGMSWFAVKMQRARRQKEAVEGIRRVGGAVYYEYQSEDPFAQPPVPKWARALLGDDLFFDVAYVSIGGGDFGDDEARHLKVLTNVTYLALHFTAITDAGLEHLEGLTNLNHLVLSDTQITDAGLENLEGLTKLKWLDLSDTQVTPESVKKLKEALPAVNLTRIPIDGRDNATH